jgi:hypothetical protein
MWCFKSCPSRKLPRFRPVSAHENPAKSSDPATCDSYHLPAGHATRTTEATTPPLHTLLISLPKSLVKSLSYLSTFAMDHSHMDHGHMDHGMPGMDHGSGPQCNMNVRSPSLPDQRRPSIRSLPNRPLCR